MSWTVHTQLPLPEIASLPCACFCRVFFVGHTAKSHFAVCHDENARQKKNTRQSLRFTMCWHTAKTLPCVFFWHTAKYTVCRVFIFLAHSKVYSFPCVFSAHGKVIIFFFSSHLETFSTLHIQHVVLLVKN